LSTNRQISGWIGARLPQKSLDAQRIYLTAIAERLNSLSGPSLVVDVGGGSRCHFAGYRPPHADITIVAVDVSSDELARNVDVDEKRAADVTKEMPFAAGTVDLVASEAVLEHLSDTERFISNCARVVKPGGTFISLFSSRFSPHALANRVLPDKWSGALLRALAHESEGRLGFAAHYDRTYASEMSRMLDRHGFSVLDLQVSYYQSPYFAFFVPFFLVSAVYELCVRALGLTNLAAYVVVVAERRHG
jgi:SAM-dependent methyltransferase